MLPSFSLRQLSYLVAVADLGSMTAAADASHVSQAAISAGINDLERLLGVQLLVRHPGHGVSLTEAGTSAVSDARRVLSAVEDLQSGVHAPRQELRGRLALGCYTTLSPWFVPALRATFRSRYPAVEIDVIENGQPELQRLLLNGTCEVILGYDTDLDAGLRTATVQTLCPYFLLAADHPLAGSESLSIRDLADEELIVFKLNPSPHNAERMLREAGLPDRIAHTSPNIEVVRSMVARGLGYTTLVQRWPHNLSMEGLPLACVPVSEPAPRYRVVAAWDARTALSRRAAAAVEVFRETARETAARRQDGTPARV